MYKSKNSFKKRDYLKILNDVVDFCLKMFGYRIRPHIWETRLNRGEMMMFCNHGRHYVIFYDYHQFRRMFGDKTYDVQQAYAMLMAAHEMRHYYQIRQIFSKTPREDEQTIEEWRENHFFGKNIGEDGCTILDFYMQPMEMDAELFAYWFVAKALDCMVKLDFIDKNYVRILRDRWIELRGDDDDDLYIFDVE